MAESFTGCATNVWNSVSRSLWNTVVEEVKMFFSLPQAITRMEKEVQTLENEIHDINAELGREQRRPKRIVKTWLDNAGESIKSSQPICNKYQAYRQHKSCLGCCPNCLLRYRISKDIREWELNVAQRYSEKQARFPSSGEYGDPTPRPQILIPNPDCGFVANAVRSEQMKLLLTWLIDQDNNTRRIGIQGMGGVGKTSLLDAINDSQEVRNSFNLVIKVTVSRNDILYLQKCVADRLNLTLPDYFEGRKDMLRSYLKNKNYLLLLDDMWADDLWTSEKLESLGVSLNDTGFKFHLTTRDKQVCASMNVQEMITVEPLLEEEGWELFRSKAFQNQNGNVLQELEEVARKIAKECKGLPLAIIVVAAAMAHHSYLHEWELALEQMQNVDKTFYDLHPGVDIELFQRLKWSYDVMTSDDLKTCFLYFGAYPEDRVILCEEIIDIWVAEGLVKGSGDSYLHDIGHSYINYLRDRCLIQQVRMESVGRISHVKIHDVLRDLAIRIGETEQHRCYFKAGQGVSHFPLEEGWARMSLMDNHLDSLPTTLACSSLSVLLLKGNPDIKEVPGSFLRELTSLKVLDLSETGITSLPPSIGNLKQLAFLQLHNCPGICELPETIGDLNNLQFLNLSSCDQLQYLPERLSELKCLRSLDIIGCSRLSHLPRGVSELVLLERLNMRCNISLDFEDYANAERKYVCFKDLQSLSRLRHFSVKIKSPVKEGVLGKWLMIRNLSLDFTDANQDYLPQDMQAMKDLEDLCVEQCDLEQLPSWVSEFRKLASLKLWYCRQLRELPAELQELPCLRRLDIRSCEKLNVLELGMGFLKLEDLKLIFLKSLESVGAGTASSGSGSGGLGGGPSPLPVLKSFTVWECDKLKRMRGKWDKLKCIKEIVGDREWWDAIQWEDPNSRTFLENKFKNLPYL